MKNTVGVRENTRYVPISRETSNEKTLESDT